MAALNREDKKSLDVDVGMSMWRGVPWRLFLLYLKVLADFSSEDLSFEGLLEVVVAGAGQGKINPDKKTVEKLMENTDISVFCYTSVVSPMSALRLVLKMLTSTVIFASTKTGNDKRPSSSGCQGSCRRSYQS